MKPNALITRRKAIVAGLAGGGGLLLSGCSKGLPPTFGNILRMGDVLTYTAHRTLLPGQSLAREYSHRDISSFPATGTTNPAEPGARFYDAAHGPAGSLLARGPQAVSLADADHPAHVRGRLVGHRRVDRRSVEPCARGGGHSAGRTFREFLPVR